MHVYRPLAGNGPPIGAHTETVDVRTDWRDHRGPHVQLAGDRRGGRNWDYRYTWIRDAAFTLYGLLRIGFTEEAEGFMRWLDARAGEVDADGSLQIVYGIDGRHDLKEQILDHLTGYRNSSPVRIGNGAYSQLQLDIYGELLDAIYLYNKHVMPIIPSGGRT